MHPLIFYAVAGTAIFAAGSGLGHKLTSDHYKAAAAEQERAAAEAYQQRTEEYHQASAELERARREKKVIYRTITQRVETYIDRPIYLRDCADDDGLRDENAALTRSANSSKPAPAVPGPDADGGQDRR